MTQNQVKKLLAYLAGVGLTAIATITAFALAGKITVSKETLGWLGAIASLATTLGIGGASPIGRVVGFKEDIVPRVPGVDSGKHAAPSVPGVSGNKSAP